MRYLPACPVDSKAHRAGCAVKPKRRRGIAATELALLVPFLAALILGMCELGRAVMIKDTLTNAARKGCRTGTAVNKTYQDIINDVDNILTDNNIPVADATVTVQIASYTGSSTAPSWGSYTTVTNNAGFTVNPLDKISVQVSIPATDVLWFGTHFMSNTAVESETLVMLRQG
jgi:Flp pilus assembly protein TadG